MLYTIRCIVDAVHGISTKIETLDTKKPVTRDNWRDRTGVHRALIERSKHGGA